MMIFRRYNDNYQHHLKLALTSVGILFLAGCATLEDMPGETIRNLAAQHPEAYHVTIESPKPPYVVKYDVTIHGNQAKSTTQPQTITQGQYQTWNWVIKADPDIAIVVQSWLHSVQPDSQTNTSGGVVPALDWDAMMRRLYKLDSYLLNAPPMPASIQVLLLPGNAYHLQTTLRTDLALPVMVIRYDSANTSPSEQFEDEQSSAVFWIQFTTQMVLSDAAWKAGMIPKPPEGFMQEEKFLATQVCWGNAAVVASIAGSNREWGQDIKGFSASPSTGLRAEIVKAASHMVPHSSSDSYSTKLHLAAVWYGIGLREYLQQQGLSGTYPERGTDIKMINANINFCRAYTHYTGDIESHPIPPDIFNGGEFFPSNNLSLITTGEKPH